MSRAALLRHRLFGESRWIPWIFVGGFGVVFAVNGIMVSTALDSWTGIVEHDYYLRGLKYNEALEDARAQAKLGWQVGVAQDNPQPGSLRLQVSLADRDGHPIAADRVVAKLERPTQTALDRAVGFSADQRGRWSAEVAALPPGQWHLRIVLHKGEHSFETVKRLMVK
ncbi:Nitrogen fixation protein FixH [Tistlia consotensis]|uniref:Nitrogen fixation protein FixH n=1 Tax=Tistlia consotensis USBA 355 TaxID=560819 RepID=A0A1Y6C1D3_9PROT|nr:FixH family protein [Tistlia consotensis]SMF40432.1 Nitrogen fixation protein FixH [Tistlia consotensis USBA 355]SNR74953.1 Nitrogen fixation protein FixH [Tistlia consotensis]